MSGYSVVATARKVPCPTCNAPRFEYCLNPDGSIRESSHPARVAAARAAPSITPPQIEALKKLHVDPTRYVDPIVRRCLLRYRLVTAPDGPPPPQPDHRRGRRPKQRLLLTDAGRAALGVAAEVDAEVKAS